MRAPHGKRLALAALALLLLVSIRSWKEIPAHAWIGLDFQNLHAFHHCLHRDNPYLGTGQGCGDVFGRGMYYPPLLYFSFVWTRWVPFALGAKLWSTLVVLLTAWGVAVFARRERLAGAAKWLAIGFGLLLLAQYPSAFAAERGNNDAIVVALWAWAFALFAVGRLGAAGLVAGATAALKIYPAFACGVIGGAVIIEVLRKRAGWGDLLRFAAGGALSVAVACVAFLPQLKAYAADELPWFAQQLAPLATFSHSLKLVSPRHEAIGAALFAALMLVWLAAAARAIGRDPALAFSGALAVSTYFSGTSYDYNLITVYPLLMVLFARAFGREWPGGGWAVYALLMFGIVAVAGDRALFAGGQGAMRVHIVLQWAWLVGTGTYCWLILEPEPAPAPEPVTP